MKLRSIRCPICLTWRTRLNHCQYCGINHVTENGRKFYYVNNHGTEVVRGVPIPFEKIIKADYRDVVRK